MGAIAIALGAGTIALHLMDQSGYALMTFLSCGLLLSAYCMQQSIRVGSMATALLGFGCSTYLFMQKFTAAGTTSICNINDLFNCDIVNRSAASEIAGIPIGVFGMGFFAGVFIAAISSRERAPQFDRVVGLLSTVGVGYSGYLIYEATQLKALCVVCITIYICNGFLLWAGMKGVKASGETLFSDLSGALTSRSLWTISGVFLVVGFAGNFQYQGHLDQLVEKREGTNVIDKSALYAEYYVSPKALIELDGTEPILGNENAQYLVIEWADFGCPHCARTNTELKQMVLQYPSIQVRYKPYPLTSQCNPSLNFDLGEHRCRSAIASMCAGEQGKFWEFTDPLYEALGNLAEAELLDLAKQFNMDVDAWTTCMSNPEIKERVIKSAEVGTAVGVEGTPGLYLRGTHGPDFIQISPQYGLSYPETLVMLVDAHQKGITLPPPQPAGAATP